MEINFEKAPPPPAPGSNHYTMVWAHCILDPGLVWGIYLAYYFISSVFAIAGKIICIFWGDWLSCRPYQRCDPKAKGRATAGHGWVVGWLPGQKTQWRSPWLRVPRTRGVEGRAFLGDPEGEVGSRLRRPKKLRQLANPPPPLYQLLSNSFKGTLIGGVVLVLGGGCWLLASCWAGPSGSGALRLKKGPSWEASLARCECRHRALA